MNNFLKDKPTKLFLFFAAFFVANALIAESIGTKIFSLEKLLGLPPAHFTLFKQSNLSFNLTCGVLLWPLEFIVTDIVNEFYGPKAVKRISLIAVTLILYAFLMYAVAIYMPPADIWTFVHVKEGIPNMQIAFQQVFGQGMRIIIGSLVAFLVSQIVDVTIFHRIKRSTGEKFIWLRATGSTLVSQLIDSYIVLFIAFYNIFSWQQILAFGMMNYFYKFAVALLLTPVIYWLEKLIENYVGKETALEMKRMAMHQKTEELNTFSAK